MKKIPTQLESNGLHQRYRIQKLVVRTQTFMGDELEEPQILVEECDPKAEYFVLRLDTGGRDINHIKAGRIGIHAYADAIEATIPQLAKDLRERYPLL